MLLGSKRTPAVVSEVIFKTSSPRATIAHLRVNKYSHWTKCVFIPYMGSTVILVKFQAYDCNGFHRIIGPVNAYPRPSCHFFPCFQNRPLPTLITYLHLLYQLFASITFQFSGWTFTYINHIPSSTISCLHLSLFSSQAAIVFKKITF